MRNSNHACHQIVNHAIICNWLHLQLVAFQVIDENKT